MNLAVALETRYSCTPNGAVWTKGPCNYTFWTRYLAGFEHVKVIARVNHVAAVDSLHHRVNGPKVTVCPVPYYVGLVEYVKSWRSVGKAIKEAISVQDALILRAPGALSDRAVAEFWRTHRPYGVEVVGDPFDVFAPDVFEHPLRPVLRYLSVRSLKKQCARAAAVSYVTERALQRRYPCQTHVYGVSDVNLQDSEYVETPRTFQTHYSSVELDTVNLIVAPQPHPPIRFTKLLFIGSLEQKYKGLDILLKALSKVCITNPSVTLTVVGDGRYRKDMEGLAQQLGLNGGIEFLGELPSGAPIRDELDRSTLLVLPSRTEGLPRVILEAMSRGVPCIASNVGGIPELLDEEDMVPANDVSSLAEKIKEVVSNPERLQRMSVRNTVRACNYESRLLQARRLEFLKALRTRTEDWLKTFGHC